MNSKIKAIILCGGEGKRLRPFTAVTPKPLLTVNGVPIIKGILSFLKNQGVDEAALTVGYKGEMIKQALGDECEGVRLTYYTEDEPLGSAGGVKRASNFITGEEFIVMCGDAECNFDLRACIDYFKRVDAQGLILTARKECSPLEYGIVVGEGQERGRVKGFVEKPSWSGVCGERINTGIYIFKKSVLDLIPEGKYDFGFDMFTKMLINGKELYYCDVKGEWRDIGNADELYLCNMESTGWKNAVAEPCRIGKDTQIQKSVLMEGVRVGEGCRISRAILGKECVIGNGVEIKDGARLGPFCVIGDGARIGEGVTVMEGQVIKSGAELSCPFYKGELFGHSGIYLSGQDSGSAHALGCAIRACFPKDDIALMYGRASAGVVNGFLSGLCSMDGTSIDLGEGFSALAAFSARNERNGLTVYIRPRKEGVFFEFYDKDGLYPGARFESLVRAQVKLVHDHMPAKVKIPPILRHGQEEKYKEALIRSSGCSFAGLSFTLYCEGAFERVLSECITSLGGRIISVGGDVIISADASGKSVDIIYGGVFFDYDHIRGICIAAYSKKGIREISLCHRSSEALKRFAAECGVRVSLYAENHYDNKESALRSNVRETPALVDGAEALMVFLGYALKNGLDGEALMGSLPVFYTKYKEMFVPRMKKQSIVLRSHGHDKEGFVMTTLVGRIRIIAENGDSMSLCAEAATMEDASEMIKRAEEYIQNFEDDKMSE